VWGDAFGQAFLKTQNQRFGRNELLFGLFKDTNQLICVGLGKLGCLHLLLDACE
jgi:hypothetical protein